jgi:hypothetical protein
MTDPEYLPPDEHLNERDRLRVRESVAKGKLPRDQRLRPVAEQLIAERLTLLDATADRVLLELCRVAFVDARRLFNSDGSTKLLEDIDEDTARAIAGIKFEDVEDGVKREYRLADKLKALELLGRYHKLFTDRVEVQGVDELIQRLQDARRRELNAENVPVG